MSPIYILFFRFSVSDEIKFILKKRTNISMSKFKNGIQNDEQSEGTNKLLYKRFVIYLFLLDFKVGSSQGF